MPYGIIKVDTVTFTDNGVDKNISLSGLVQNPTFTGNVTATGTISGDVIRGGTTISGVTVTGTTANFVSGVFTTQVSGATVIAPTGTFTSLTGTTATFTSGIIASGTAALPSLAVLSDPNTGLFSPGADQLAISTNGTSRFSINASGNIGVGGTVGFGAIDHGIHITGSAAQEGIRLESSAGSGGILEIYAESGGSTLDTRGSNYIRFNSSATEFARFDSSGRFGLGDTTPSVRLSVLNGTDNSDVAVFSGGDRTRGLKITTGAAGGNNDALVKLNAQNSAGQFAVLVNGSEAYRVDNSGRLGIGNSDPRGIVHVGADLNNGATDAAAINLKQTSTTPATGIYLERSGARTGYYIYLSGDSDSLAFRRNYVGTKSDVMSLTRDGNVGIGTTSPSVLTHLYTSTDTQLRVESTSASSANEAALQLIRGSNQSAIKNKAGGLEFFVQGLTNEVARIDSSGRLLVGTSTNTNQSGVQGLIQIEALSGEEAAIKVKNNQNTTSGASLSLSKSRGTAINSSTAVQNGDSVGNIYFFAADGTDTASYCAEIAAVIDGAPGSNDVPGRLVFSTTADGAASPTERMRITSGGYLKASNTATYYGSTGTYHEFNSSLNLTTLISNNTNASFSSEGLNGGVTSIIATRSGSSAYSLLCTFSNAANDVEHNLRGDGNAYADGTWTGGGADYAEYFEWSDDNPDKEDRRGISVTLDGNKIRESITGEDPIGVISGNPSMVGDAAWNKWSGKYLRDEFGTYIQEDYEVEDDEGNTVVQQRRKLNPDYDSDAEYIPREQRPEWDCVGLMGKLRIRKGQPTGSRWIKMRDINDFVEEWLVR